MKVLEEEIFKNNNASKIVELLYEDSKANMPPFYFESEKYFEEAYYNFLVGDTVLFNGCKIALYDTRLEGKEKIYCYLSGSYQVSVL